jgi:hypothetical protein
MLTLLGFLRAHKDTKFLAYDNQKKLKSFCERDLGILKKVQVL